MIQRFELLLIYSRYCSLYIQVKVEVLKVLLLVLVLRSLNKAEYSFSVYSVAVITQSFITDLKNFYQCCLKNINYHIISVLFESLKTLFVIFIIIQSNIKANIKAMSKFNLAMLEPCAEFLNVTFADSESNRIFTKDALILVFYLQLKHYSQ